MQVRKVGVVGAGMMGAEIALCFAQCGYETLLSDTSLDIAEQGKRKLEALLDKRVAKGKLDAADKALHLGAIVPVSSLEALRDCDLIVEAIVEVPEIKHTVFAQLDAVCKEHTVLASNTSSISLTKLSAAVSEQRAGRFLGTHFNSPASIMKLVEVIPALRTDPVVTETLTQLLRSIGKAPVLVKDVTGFALNRLFHVFYLEACRLVEEGVCSHEDVDTICLHGLGHPMGIFKLLDNLGHDLNLNVDRILFDAYGERFRPSPQIQRLVDAGRLGRKTGKGFYSY